jgi:hypothetical protein
MTTLFQRNGHWSTGNIATTNGGSGYNGVSNGGNGGDVNASNGSGSQRGSQSALLSVRKERHKWPKGKDFLFSTWAFVIGTFFQTLEDII